MQGCLQLLPLQHRVEKMILRRGGEKLKNCGGTPRPLSRRSRGLETMELAETFLGREGGAAERWDTQNPHSKAAREARRGCQAAREARRKARSGTHPEGEPPKRAEPSRPPSEAPTRPTEAERGAATRAKRTERTQTKRAQRASARTREGARSGDASEAKRGRARGSGAQAERLGEGAAAGAQGGDNQ